MTDFETHPVGTGKRLTEVETENAMMRVALENLACRHVAEKPLWWQNMARAALAAIAEKKDD